VVKKFPDFKDTGRSLPCLQKLAVGLYSEPVNLIPHIHTFLKVRLDNFLPYERLSEVVASLRGFPAKIFPMRVTWPPHLYLNLIARNIR